MGKYSSLYTKSAHPYGGEGGFRHPRGVNNSSGNGNRFVINNEARAGRLKNRAYIEKTFRNQQEAYPIRRAALKAEANAAKRNLNAKKANFEKIYTNAKAALNRAKATALANHKKLPFLKRPLRGPNLSVNALKNKFNWLKTASNAANRANKNYENAAKKYKQAQKNLESHIKHYRIYENPNNRQRELIRRLSNYPILK